MTELLSVAENIDIGRGSSCNIVFKDFPELSSFHIRICKKEEEETLYMLGKNGGYINGRFISRGTKYNLNFADEICFLEIKMLWLSDAIAIRTDCAKKYEIHSLKKWELDKKSEKDLVRINKETDTESNIYFSKAPRLYYLDKDEAIELEPPPEKRVDERQSVFLTIGPAFTMSLPMIMGIILSRLATKNTGYSSVFMLTGVITAVCSTLLGVMWGISNFKSKRNQLLQDERKRKEIYREYVRESEARIREQYNKRISHLRLMYPQIHEYVPDKINRFLLWNRNKGDEDFLKIRIGTGNIPCSINVQIPKERFSMVDDELKNLPRKLKNKYSILRDVPETVNLFEERFIGVVCSSKRIIEETFLSSVIMTAVSLSPEDISIKCLFFDGMVDATILEAIRFLPHLSSKKEHIEDNEITIIFTDNYEKVKHQIDENTYLFILSNHFEKIPAVCKFIIQRESHFSGFVRLDKNCSERRTIQFDSLLVSEAERVSRLLRGIKVHGKEEKYVLPNKISFMDIYETELNGHVILSNWEKNDIRDKIVCPIGVDEEGKTLILDLNEKGMGPHGLIAGMTGSGKSEILQTIILSLAINYSPEDVGFFLIDYKGGGMSKLFEMLPHLMGSISNLSGRMIARAMASVNAENQRRQQLFIRAGVNNINQYRSISTDDKSLEPLPHIFIIVDEFAELKKEEPEFMKDLISVARVGRSLGIHLILATQKPAGVVDDNVFSNSRFRICLRVQDRMDSMEMLRKSGAEYITNVGRGILQVGNDEIYKLFQGAYTMERAKSSRNRKKCQVYDIHGNELMKSIVKNEENKEDVPQLYKVKKYIEEASTELDYRKPSQLWLEPLPEQILKDTCALNRFEIAIGILDNPEKQCQEEYVINLIDGGNTIILGELQSGKSTLIETIMFGILSNTNEDFYNIFIIDFSTGLLKAFKDSRMCSGYISEDNEEDVEKLVILILDIIANRKQLLGGSNYGDYIKSKTVKDSGYIPPIIIIIDGLQLLRERTHGKFDRDLEHILRVSEGLGIFVFATVINMSSQEISRRMADCFKTSIPLQLKDKYEYKDALRIQKGDFTVPERISGRGLARIENEICEFQVYKQKNVQNRLLEIKLREDKNEYATSFRIQLPLIPKKLNIGNFITEINKRKNDEFTGIPIGFDLRSGKVFNMPYVENLNVLICGRARSGKTNLLRIIERMSEYTNHEVKEKVGSESIEEIIVQGKDTKLESLIFENGMRVFVYDETLPFDVLLELKKLSGDDPYVINLGGGLDRQNVADFSYIPYSKQTEISKAGIGIVRKTIKGYQHGEIIVPNCSSDFNEMASKSI